MALVSPELAAAVDARLRSAAAPFERGTRGWLARGAIQAPGYVSPYLLTGLTRCAVCDGPIGTITRMHGTGTRRWTRHEPSFDKVRVDGWLCSKIDGNFYLGNTGESVDDLLRFTVQEAQILVVRCRRARLIGLVLL